MNTTRRNKVERLIQQDIGDILLKEMKSVFGSSLLTVTRVGVTPDLAIARVHISVMPIGDLPQTSHLDMVKADKETVMERIKTVGSDIRYRLGMRERGQLRVIPRLEFYLDDTLDYIENIERLLKQ